MEISGYTRISVDLQEDLRENTSIENQKCIIRDFVRDYFPDANLTIYEDRDRSGYTFAQRENYQLMRRLLLNGEYKILIVKDFSRFSRRNSLGLLELETLRDAGVRIISIGDNIDYPTKDDWILIQFKFLMNEMPVTDTSKKIRQMINNRQKNGQWICAVPYGYRIINTKSMSYEIDAPAAEIVREVFRLYNNGWGYKKIANHLTENGVPTPRANLIAQKEAEGKVTKLKSKNEWSIISVQGILKNDFYIGVLRQKKYRRKGINGKDIRTEKDEQIAIENAHEGIVDIKSFAYAQEQLKLRSKNNYRGEKKYSNDYSGFLFCGDCGSPMFSMSRKDIAPAYTCGTYHRRGLKGCTSHHIRVDMLNNLLKRVIKHVRDNCEDMMIELENSIKNMPDKEEQLGNTIESIEQQLNGARKELKALYKQKILSTIGKTEDQIALAEDIYSEMETELTNRITFLEAQFKDTNNLRNTLIQTNRKAKTVIDVFDDIINKENLDKRDIGLIINRITVFEDRLTVKLKSDVDMLFSLDDKEEVINFNEDSKDSENIKIVQSTRNHVDKVFTVNVVREGDPLEIYTEQDGEVVFKKYSPIGEFSPFVGQYVEVLAKSSERPTIVFDRDHIVAVAGIPKNEYLERRSTQKLDDLMQSRKSFVSKGKNDTLKPVEGINTDARIVCPIISAGDVNGAVVMLSKKQGDSKVSEADYKLAQTAAEFLGRQLEC